MRGSLDRDKGSHDKPPACKPMSLSHLPCQDHLVHFTFGSNYGQAHPACHAQTNGIGLNFYFGACQHAPVFGMCLRPLTNGSQVLGVSYSSQEGLLTPMPAKWSLVILRTCSSNPQSWLSVAFDSEGLFISACYADRNNGWVQEATQ